MNIEKTTHLLTVILAPLLLLGCFVAPSMIVVSFWLCLMLCLFGVFGILADKYLKIKARKNYSIVFSSLCASVATYFATGGAFPPISLIFSLLFVLNILVFFDLQKKDNRMRF